MILDRQDTGRTSRHGNRSRTRQRLRRTVRQQVRRAVGDRVGPGIVSGQRRQVSMILDRQDTGRTSRHGNRSRTRQRLRRTVRQQVRRTVHDIVTIDKKRPNIYRVGNVKVYRAVVCAINRRSISENSPRASAATDRSKYIGGTVGDRVGPGIVSGQRRQVSMILDRQDTGRTSRHGNRSRTRQRLRRTVRQQVRRAVGDRV